MRTRAEAMARPDSASATFSAWLADPVETPFGMGTGPVAVTMEFPAFPTRWHHARLDYLQTAHVDFRWHRG